MSRYPWRNTSEDISSQTPSQWETPGGAQKKADQAEKNAKDYTDTRMNEHVGKGGTAHANAVPNGEAGFITGADKAKLDGVQAGANNYVHPATHPPSIIVQDVGNRFVTDSEKATWNAKATTDEATQTVKGLMAAADKVKLDGVQAGAEVNQNAFSTVNTIEAASKTDKVMFTGGTGITVTTDLQKKEIKITATGDATPGKHAETHMPGGTDVIPYATSTTGGLMAPEDKNSIADQGSALTNHIADNVKHITAVERSTWNSKANGVHTHDAADIVSGTISTARLPVSSVSAAGIVQLSAATNGTRTDVAATESAVKAAYDEAQAAKQAGVDARGEIAGAVNAKGVPASASDTINQLVSKIGQISTGIENAYMLLYLEYYKPENSAPIFRYDWAEGFKNAQEVSVSVLPEIGYVKLHARRVSDAAIVQATTRQPVNLTNVGFVELEYHTSRGFSNINVQIGVMANYNTTGIYYDRYKQVTTSSSDNDRLKLLLDVRDLSGPFYVGFDMMNSGSSTIDISIIAVRLIQGL
ncbi:phage tail protein [Paenibacillus apiarius]|uniref:phage tail protein n=1 Tax=Paenibacillus apiarius TaxID=46240 RepID=UPI003B3A9F79